MKVRVEMGARNFTLSARVAGFQPDEDLDIVLTDGFALTGRVESTTDGTYGPTQTPCTRIKIALTSSNIAQRQDTYLRGAAVTGRRSHAQGTICALDTTKYSHCMVQQKYAAGIVAEIEKLLELASRLKDDAKAKLWFGNDLNRTQLLRVHYDTGQMHEGLRAVSTMNFVCVSGVFLAAADLDMRDRFKPTGCQVQLGKGFAFERYSWGERVCTLAHELSHWFLGTIDATYQGEDAYGLKAFDMVNDIIETERRKCLKNAENWGYYICSYRGDGDDWSNMTRDEIAARPVFDAAVQRVNHAILHEV